MDKENTQLVANMSRLQLNTSRKESQENEAAVIRRRLSKFNAAGIAQDRALRTLDINKIRLTAVSNMRMVEGHRKNNLSRAPSAPPPKQTKYFNHRPPTLMHGSSPLAEGKATTSVRAPPRKKTRRSKWKTGPDIYRLLLQNTLLEKVGSEMLPGILQANDIVRQKAVKSVPVMATLREVEGQPETPAQARISNLKRLATAPQGFDPARMYFLTCQYLASDHFLNDGSIIDRYEEELGMQLRNIR
jgi:hypothetical protein